MNVNPLICSVLGALLLLMNAVAAETTTTGSEAAFLARCAELAAKDNMTVAGTNGWLFLTSELRHLSAGSFWGDAAPKVSRATKPEFADPLPAIEDFKKQLDRLGIELILLPVPPKAVVYADQLSDEAPLNEQTHLPVRTDAALQAFYGLFAERGVTVLDLTPTFLAERKNDLKLGPVYCRTDTHWSGRGCQIAAARVAALLKQRGWMQALPQKPFESRSDEIQIDGDLRAGLETQARERVPVERLPLRFVGAGGAGLASLADDPASPVLLLGDSHCLVFHVGQDLYASGAGLPDQLALELGATIDVMGVRGSGATPARINLYRMANAEPDYLRRKKVVIWCFSAREFTESPGWRLVPVIPAAAVTNAVAK